MKSEQYDIPSSIYCPWKSWMTFQVKRSAEGFGCGGNSACPYNSLTSFFLYLYQSMQEPNCMASANVKIWATNDLFSPADCTSSSHQVPHATVGSPVLRGKLPHSPSLLYSYLNLTLMPSFAQNHKNLSV